MSRPALVWLGLNRNTTSVAGAGLLMALGEELWKRFLPKYLESSGAPLLVVGAYGSTRDLLDGLAQYPGGWISDRYGRRVGLQIFIGIAIIGYLLLVAGRSWALIFAGTVLALAWTSMASPTVFAVIGDALPPGRRAMGFSVQSILRRIPIAVAPVLGGMMIASRGVLAGVRLGLMVTIALAAGNADVGLSGAAGASTPEPVPLHAGCLALPSRIASAVAAVGYSGPHLRGAGGRVSGDLRAGCGGSAGAAVRAAGLGANDHLHPGVSARGPAGRSDRAEAAGHRDLRGLRSLPTGGGAGLPRSPDCWEPLSWVGCERWGNRPARR